MSDAADRTIPATPRRREMARRRGVMPMAGLPAWVATVATSILLLPAWAEATVSASITMVRQAATFTTPGADAEAWPWAVLPATVVIPTLALVAVAGAVGLAVRMLLDAPSWRPARIAPSLHRVGLLAGLSRIFSMGTLTAMVGNACGLAVLLTATAFSMRPLISLMSAGPIVCEPSRVFAAVHQSILPLVAVAAAVATGTWWVSRLRFERRIRMTPQEYADEARSMQADPKVRLMRQQRRAGAAKNERG